MNGSSLQADLQSHRSQFVLRVHFLNDLGELLLQLYRDDSTVRCEL